MIMSQAGVCTMVVINLYISIIKPKPLTMEFKILSHAGLIVTANSGKTLVCDPWLIGSSYWRSWWNYPPVSKSLVDSLKPDYIYLTHIHWDHFHGPSLKKFSPDTCIIVPKGNYSRM